MVRCDWSSDVCSSDLAIRKCLESYQAKDDRIKVVFRQENGHISLATNSALEMAEGELDRKSVV